MNPAWGHLVGVFIVVLMLVFIGIWAWAWLPYHKRTFDRLARIPMHDPMHDPMHEPGHEPVRNNGLEAAAHAAEIEDKAP